MGLLRVAAPCSLALAILGWWSVGIRSFHWDSPDHLVTVSATTPGPLVEVANCYSGAAVTTRWWLESPTGRRVRVWTWDSHDPEGIHEPVGVAWDRSSQRFVLMYRNGLGCLGVYGFSYGTAPLRCSWEDPGRWTDVILREELRHPGADRDVLEEALGDGGEVRP